VHDLLVGFRTKILGHKERRHMKNTIILKTNKN
jgi:hypothetical protein